MARKKEKSKQLASLIAATPKTPESRRSQSAYSSETEDENPKNEDQSGVFPFLALPSELRNKIYSLVFSPDLRLAAPVFDLDAAIFRMLQKQRMLALFGVCRQTHLEASHRFFSTHTFRIFPTEPRYFSTKRPLLARLPPHYRSSITSLELRLGPGWGAPPPGWAVNKALGLKDCVNVRVLKVFVECDPSDAVFKGFRKSDGFYERFSQNLLEGVLGEVPSIRVVEFDAWSGAKRTGSMIAKLGEVASRFEKIIAYEPDKG
jgi:hypothetical protein